MNVSERRIVHRTRGHGHGPITRLMSPSDLGQRLKPFVFLDHFVFGSGAANFSGIGLHPHSGIATLTYLFEGSVRYEDTTGATGLVPEGGLEWFKAAHGAWHGGGPGNSIRTRGFQLWIALPAEHELDDVESIYQPQAEIRGAGPALVLVGNHEGVSSSLQAPSSINYLAVRLKTGETWSYQPPKDQTVCWLALSIGRLRAPEPIDAGELVLFGPPSGGSIGIRAESDSEFVVGSAAPHPYELALGAYSVHTSEKMLRAGESHIAEVARRLMGEGRLPQDSM